MFKKIISVCWLITSECNLACKHCFRPAGLPSMPPEKWRFVLEKLRKNGVKRVVFTGGEPLLVKGFTDLLEMAKKIGFITSLITNGKLLDFALFKKLSECLDDMAISIDSHDYRVHENMKGLAKADFNGIMDLLGQIGKSEVRLRVNTVVSRKNYGSIRDLGRVLEKKGVDEWRLIQFYPMFMDEKLASRFSVSEEEFDRLRNSLAEEYRDSKMRLTFGDIDSMSGSYFSIAPDGRVFTSDKGKVVWLGSILDDSFKDMLESKKLDFVRHYEQYKDVKNWRRKKRTGGASRKKN